MGKSFSKLKGDTEEIIHFGKKYKFTKVDKVVSTYLKIRKDQRNLFKRLRFQVSKTIKDLVKLTEKIRKFK